MQHRKLYDGDPRLAAYSDKVTVKQFVADVIGPEWLIPTLWAGAVLPPREERRWPFPFIVKASHASGWNFIARKEADWPQVEEKAARWVRTPWGRHHHEEFYNTITRQAIVEPLLGDPTRDLEDYKLYVFDGRVRFIQVDSDRRTNHKRSFFDPEWRLQPFTMGYPRIEPEPPRPPHFEQMLGAAERLARGFSFVRIDLYDLPGGPRFGEISFTPDSGLSGFSPARYDRVFGELWAL